MIKSISRALTRSKSSKTTVNSVNYPRVAAFHAYVESEKDIQLNAQVHDLLNKS